MSVTDGRLKFLTWSHVPLRPCWYRMSRPFETNAFEPELARMFEQVPPSCRRECSKSKSLTPFRRSPDEDR